MKRENIYNKSIPKYNSVDSILDHFRIRENQLENILLEMEKNQRLAYTYYYGINRPKLDLEDISEMLQVSENVVKIYINQADDFIQRLCQNITAPIPGVVENKGRRTKNKKISFFDYFEEKDKPLVLEIIEEYKEKDLDYYEILVKACGEKYDHLVLSALTREEKIKLNNFRAIIKNKIKNGKLPKKTVPIKKQNFFDYFEEKDKPLVLKVIEEYKEKDSDYYKVLIKEYGEKYDSLVDPSLLTEEEKIKLNNFRAIIRSKIKSGNFSKKPGPTKKQSFFDYFDEKDKDFVLKIIEEYKEKDSDYYKVLVKTYGEKYDHLVETSPLTKKEKNQLQAFKKVIEKKLQKGTLKSGPTKKQSFFDYFEEKDKPLVLEIIEEYKEKDSDYYKVLIKEYGEQYDSLVVPSLLNDREKNRLRDFKSAIREKLQDIKSTKNQTLQNEDFNYDLSMSYIYRRFPNLKQEKEADLIILTSFINKKKSVESISALTKFPIKKIDFILLKHLYVFSFKMPEIIEDILRRGSYTVSQIVNFNYIQTQVPFLNDKEKELLYLKMVELYQNQLSDVLKFSDKEMKYKMKTLKFEDFN